MAGPEKKIENSIKRYLDTLNAYYIKIHGSAYMPAGTPDILSCINGRFVAIEVKREMGGRVSELQKLKLKQIEKTGGIGIIARSVSDVSERLKRECVI